MHVNLDYLKWASERLGREATDEGGSIQALEFLNLEPGKDKDFVPVPGDEIADNQVRSAVGDGKSFEVR